MNAVLTINTKPTKAQFLTARGIACRIGGGRLLPWFKKFGVTLLSQMTSDELEDFVAAEAGAE